MFDARDPETDEEISIIENILRPKMLDDIIGRQKEKDYLKIIIDAARQRGEPIDHIILHGPPGLGKTSIAHVVANEVGTQFYSTSGPAIMKKGDLASILTNIETNGILFIDEIHRLNKSIEEMLYSAMEDRNIDIIIGKGPSAKSIKLELNPFTIIGATTRIGLLSAPLRDRFGIDLHLDYYPYEELKLLVSQKANILGEKIDEDAAMEIARRSRRTPRIAIRILKRVRDLSQVKGNKNINKEVALEGLKMLEIDEHGLDNLDRRILKTLLNNFKGGPVGLSTLAAAVSEDIGTLQDVYEPFLLKEGFLNRTPRGRVVTDKTIKYFENEEH
jgi:Holliday junction DNA helicase RuvB